MPNKIKSLWDVMLTENGWKVFRAEYSIFEPEKKSAYFRRLRTRFLVESFCFQKCWFKSSASYMCLCVSFIVRSNQPFSNITKLTCSALFTLLEVSVVAKSVL